MRGSDTCPISKPYSVEFQRWTALIAEQIHEAKSSTARREWPGRAGQAEIIACGGDREAHFYDAGLRHLGLRDQSARTPGAPMAA